VQSTTLGLLAAHGIVGAQPDYAIFADTGWGTGIGLRALRWLMSPNACPSRSISFRPGISVTASSMLARRTLGLDPSIHLHDPSRRCRSLSS